jgi:Ribbon-helix-helix protein, copG family
MKNTAKRKRPSADEIAEKAMSGEDISRFFTNKGKMIPAIQRVNVDFSVDMLKELDALAKELNISRQAVIKTYLRRSLDRHYLARKAAAS